MVIYQGYCRPLKQKVDFTVDTVECLETKKGQKWVVKGVHEGHKITTFTNKATGESLMEKLGITREAEEVVVFDAEEEVIETPNHEEVAEEIEVFDAEEVVLEAPKIEHEELTSKHYRKDGTLDMRYKICREIARGMKAESFDAESCDYCEEPVAYVSDIKEHPKCEHGQHLYCNSCIGAENDFCLLCVEGEEFEAEGKKVKSVIETAMKEYDEYVADKEAYDDDDIISFEEWFDDILGNDDLEGDEETLEYLKTLPPYNSPESNDWIWKIYHGAEEGGKCSCCGNKIVNGSCGCPSDCPHCGGRPLDSETFDAELKKDSCCCGADKEKPCACMFTGADCSAKEPMCQCYKDLAEAKDAEESFDAETYNKVYKAEPNAIIFEEHIPPEVWNNMGPDAQGHYLSTRDESVLIAPCCGVTKAELRMDENANAECDSCCYSGDDFHRRWWANKPAPKVRAKLEAETVEQESLNPNTVVVPRFVYYKMMMHLPPNVSITQTDDGLSMIIGFHNQDAQKIDALVEAYTPVQDGSDVEDTLVVKDGLSIVPSVYYPEESMDFDAEIFNVELQEWGEQEMKTHGKDISFKDWLDEESETHGDMPLVEWAKDEEESHDERYGAESRPASYMVGSDIHELGNATDKLERLTDSSKEYPEWWKSKLSVATDEVDGLADYLDYAEDSGAIDRLQAESFEAPVSQPPKMNKTLVGLLGLGALGAFLAPEQIRALFKKLK